ncbi:MAG: hypothetical protein JRN20_00775 [Nitrososphaerota archaeon]|jgi:hypothetical protein|nr:hypothetical protein [Nitrososphaerota archaeon]
MTLVTELQKYEYERVDAEYGMIYSLEEKEDATLVGVEHWSQSLVLHSDTLSFM